eukprot:Blabericola_migrator_1__8765@NODE_4618_length_1056_cov_5_480283_g2871_i0_p1_GENE_NODE_4618_length_1056_cov_5_480283_g2871_i0NODE_4618_length_1056_cov_5_480283_g2871_i0_p1_ORF_typecomplete_len252_score17_31Bcl2/PF00452_19/0_17SpoIIIAH/PF12685_7/1_3Alpha_GJ/PF03229_13/2_3Glyco_hydro_16/PF00722_21/1_7e02Glyco_hydro_16/PF00722_21/2_3_NODE_4618_length_1056_cov_5_480283_g2871_i0173928
MTHQNKIARTNKPLLGELHTEQAPTITQGTQHNNAQRNQVDNTTTTETSTTTTTTTKTPANTPTRFRLYTLPSTDKTTVQGPVILTWYRDYLKLAFNSPGQFRPNTITRRHLTVDTALEAIHQLQRDRQKRYETILTRIETHKLKKDESQEWHTKKAELEDTRITAHQDQTVIQKIYTIAFSAERIQGGAIVFCYADLSAICLDLASQPLPCSRFRSWTWQQKTEAAQWMENEIALTNQRVANRRIMRTMS